jgi:hypothetical protein
MQRMYPGQLIEVRSLVELMFAAFFFYLRLWEAHWRPAGHVEEC